MSGCDYVILPSGGWGGGAGWALITDDYVGGRARGVKNSKKLITLYLNPK